MYTPLEAWWEEAKAWALTILAGLAIFLPVGIWLSRTPGEADWHSPAGNLWPGTQLYAGTEHGEKTYVGTVADADSKSVTVDVGDGVTVTLPRGAVTQIWKQAEERFWVK